MGIYSIHTEKNWHYSGLGRLSLNLSLHAFPLTPKAFINKWDVYWNVPRIRIDKDAKKKLDKASDVIEGTKTGIASELVRDGCEEIIQEYKDGT